MLREMMLFHIGEIEAPGQRVEQARALARFLAESQSGPEFYGKMLESLNREIGRLEDGSFFHDHLAEINSPVYFNRFMDHARRHGLEYLAEADFFDMQHDALPPEIPASPWLKDDIVAREQYRDFLTCRRFRQTLLCHEQVTLDRAPGPERVMNLFVASSARPVSGEPVIGSGAVEMFKGGKGATMSTNHPLTKAAMLQLARTRPGSLHFKELLQASRFELSPELARRNGDIAREDALRLGRFLLKAYASNLVELHAHPSQFALEPGERPMASRLARLQLKNGAMVTTLRHTSLKITDAVGRQLLALLDGSRDREDLLEELSRLVGSGQVVMRREGKDVSDKQEALYLLADELEENLEMIARLALLVA
jgi:methyltransferase-like protein